MGYPFLKKWVDVAAEKRRQVHAIVDFVPSGDMKSYRVECIFCHEPKASVQNGATRRDVIIAIWYEDHFLQ